jgi:hypothetical protein
MDEKRLTKKELLVKLETCREGRRFLEKELEREGKVAPGHCGWWHRKR